MYPACKNKNHRNYIYLCKVYIVCMCVWMLHNAVHISHAMRVWTNNELTHHTHRHCPHKHTRTYYVEKPTPGLTKRLSPDSRIHSTRFNTARIHNIKSHFRQLKYERETHKLNSPPYIYIVKSHHHFEHNSFSLSIFIFRLKRNRPLWKFNAQNTRTIHYMCISNKNHCFYRERYRTIFSFCLISADIFLMLITISHFNDKWMAHLMKWIRSFWSWKLFLCLTLLLEGVSFWPKKQELGS